MSPHTLCLVHCRTLDRAGRVFEGVIVEFSEDWGVVGGMHGCSIPGVRNPRFRTFVSPLPKNAIIKFLPPVAPRGGLFMGRGKTFVAYGAIIAVFFM